MSLRIWLKWLMFPGLNLHARRRYEVLPAFFTKPMEDQRNRVLDAGSGNGMLAYRSYLKGSEVIGISSKETEVANCRVLFNEYLGIPEGLLRFEHGNLYDVDFQDGFFDEIICSEVLEHVCNDAAVCANFWRMLKPGGQLHVCAPNADHPYNAAFPLDRHERGGHVRAGYTLRTYRSLLEPLGFRIQESVGVGGPVRQAFNWRIKVIQERYGAMAGLPLFLAALPCLWFENCTREREMPFSLYVRVVK